MAVNFLGDQKAKFNALKEAMKNAVNKDIANLQRTMQQQAGKVGAIESEAKEQLRQTSEKANKGVETLFASLDGAETVREAGRALRKAQRMFHPDTRSGIGSQFGHESEVAKALNNLSQHINEHNRPSRNNITDHEPAPGHPPHEQAHGQAPHEQPHGPPSHSREMTEHGRHTANMAAEELKTLDEIEQLFDDNFNSDVARNMWKSEPNSPYGPNGESPFSSSRAENGDLNLTFRSREEAMNFAERMADMGHDFEMDINGERCFSSKEYWAQQQLRHAATPYIEQPLMIEDGPAANPVPFEPHESNGHSHGDPDAAGPSNAVPFEPHEMDRQHPKSPVDELIGVMDGDAAKHAGHCATHQHPNHPPSPANHGTPPSLAGNAPSPASTPTPSPGQ